ncbi:hypothetical protein ACVWYU_000993 [Pseudomonas sp. TE12234]
MADEIDRANDQAQYLLDVALQRRRLAPSSRASAEFARIATTPSRCFDNRRLPVAKPASTVRGCGRLGDD